MNFTIDSVKKISADDIAMHHRVLRSGAAEKVKNFSRAAIHAACKTPGAVYSISVKNPPQVIELSVVLPASVARLNEAQATRLEQELHDAAESILAKFFTP